MNDTLTQLLNSSKTAAASQQPIEPFYRVLLVSTYELGHQPFGLASPAAWLNRVGASVRCIDLSREPFRAGDFENVDFVGFYMHMHTATRLAGQLIPKVAQINENAHLCAYGLYAPMNESFLRSLGVTSIVGGEFEEELAKLVSQLKNGGACTPLSTVSFARQQFVRPDRSTLPALSTYSQLMLPDGSRRVAGYTEASRGCKHLCRHCPIVPIYKGKFRVVQRETVLQDIRQQVLAGAQHITFGDPDFFNGIGHSLPLVQMLHEEFPNVTYDVTIKIEHLLKDSSHIGELKETGCAFVTSAVESVDDGILRLLEKGHTREDFIHVVEMCKTIGLPMSPTFVSFTPWITLGGYREMLELIADLEIVGWVAPVQWAIRLLIPNGSRLLELPEARAVVAGFDSVALSYRWTHPDPRMDLLQQKVERVVRESSKLGLNREQVFEMILEAAGGSRMPTIRPIATCSGIPYFTEPWYCCAEPTSEQLASL